MNPARSTAGVSPDDPRRANQYDGAMRPIPLGAKGTFTLRVTPARLANQFKDAMLPPVFATPMMIMAMENAALNAIRAYLEPGESAVGTAVDVRHLAATPVGHDVTAEAEVTQVDGRRVQFKDTLLPPGFATPVMIMAMENAALNAIRAYLEPGESAVGTAVDVRHLAATPVGHDVTAEAEVTQVDGRRVEFNVMRATRRRRSAAAPTSAWWSTCAG